MMSNTVKYNLQDISLYCYDTLQSNGIAKGYSTSYTKHRDHLDIY
jgi:hypothetical protein